MMIEEFNPCFVEVLLGGRKVPRSCYDIIHSKWVLNTWN